MRSAVNKELIVKRLIYLSCLVMLFGLSGPRLGSAQSSAGVEGLLDKINRLPGTECQQKLVEGARTVVAGCHSNHSPPLVPSDTALAVTQ